MTIFKKKGKVLSHKILFALLFILIAVSGCASKPHWIYPSGESRQFYEDENLCSTRAERSMGNATGLFALVAKNRAMSGYKKCMKSMGYIESN
jgi:hypothetical protein